MSRATSAIDPRNYASLALTHVQYNPSDPLAKLLSLITLSPIFLLCSYTTIILYRRELTFINALLGQLLCEALNFTLKRAFKQPRPSLHLGNGYGMPSSHSQFVGFFASFFLLHFHRNRPPRLRPRTLVNVLRRFEHVIATLAIATLSLLTCYSRYHLHYHSPNQILVGFSIGLLFGSTYYYITEHRARIPPQIAPSSKQRKQNRFRQTAPPAQGVVRRRKASQTKRPNSTVSSAGRFERGVSVRQRLLEHPIAVALRVRDGWTVWKDGGIEAEYRSWRTHWLSQSTPPTAPIDTGRLPRHYQMMRRALDQADQSSPTDTAFCVGCIISLTNDTINPNDINHINDINGALAGGVQDEILATGYSRELPGNTHAEQCALEKLSLFKNSSSKTGKKEKVEGVVELDLYTTMEPCSERLSGNLPCVQRILQFNQTSDVYYHRAKLVRFRIKRVFQGVKEPDDFVKCQGQNILREAHVEVLTVKTPPNSDEKELESECLRIARKGHSKSR